jgi:hypothetical protein
MDWLWILLRYLFPTDPARQAAEAARQCIATLVAEFFAPETLAVLAVDDSARAYIEAIINDYEACVHLAIGARACQIAGLRFKTAARPFHPPARARSIAQLTARIRALVALCNDIERLAQLRAARLKRAYDTDPIGLAAHSDAMRAASSSTSARSGLILSSARSARPSKDEAVLTAARHAKSRVPRVFHVCLQPQPASEARLLRSHPHAKSKKGPVLPSGLLHSVEQAAYARIDARPR